MSYQADVVVVGAGGMAREAAAWASAAGLHVVGFLSDDASVHGKTVAGLEVLGDADWLSRRADVRAVVGVGAPRARSRLCARLKVMGVTLATVVHPSATVGPRCVLGEGTVVCPRVVLTTDVILGEAVIINFGAVVGHDGRVGDHVFVGPNAALGGDVDVGARAYVGIGASVRHGLVIGEDAVVGAGAAVVRDVEAGVIVVGVPAKPLTPG